ncbi:ATP-binding cassette domain-containing protein [Sphaerisporangium fuscum]|uniref:ATP-binding cassette domain-containing protein n=1 Tax=Sphaerisporangium fuscum TaxID=2835868 RepID=UPI001BDCD789|nr:ATP-binding cassette domain-containing protein [Sphaerisporangium fuscum]
MPGERPETPAILASGLSLKGGHGWVYRDIDLDVAAGSLLALVGESGSGRTSLLLTLAGRMRPTDGTLAVAGQTKLHRIRRLAALGLVDGVNDLDEGLSVREHVHERLRPHRPLPYAAVLRARELLGRPSTGPRHGGRRHRDDQIAEAVLLDAGLDVSVLSEGDRTLVRYLGRDQRMRLGIALALLDEPELLLVDNLDAGLRDDQRGALLTTLRGLTGRGLTVVVAATEPPAGVDAVVSLVREQDLHPHVPETASEPETGRPHDDAAHQAHQTQDDTAREAEKTSRPDGPAGAAPVTTPATWKEQS